MRLWADFNEVYEGSIWTSLRRAKFVPKGEPRIGQWIELWDHEGNSCFGVVTKVDAPIVYLRLDLSTWIDSEAVRISPRYGHPAFSSGQGKHDSTIGGVKELELAGR